MLVFLHFFKFRKNQGKKVEPLKRTGDFYFFFFWLFFCKRGGFSLWQMFNWGAFLAFISPPTFFFKKNFEQIFKIFYKTCLRGGGKKWPKIFFFFIFDKSGYRVCYFPFLEKKKPPPPWLIPGLPQINMKFWFFRFPLKKKNPPLNWALKIFFFFTFPPKENLLFVPSFLTGAYSQWFRGKTPNLCRIGVFFWA